VVAAKMAGAGEADTKPGRYHGDLRSFAVAGAG
jgi:hypothetical protein